MNDWGMSVLSQYPVTVRTTRKVRGALLCDTKEGLYLLSEYRGKQARLEAEAALLLYLAENGMVHTDQIIKNEKEELLSKNEEGTGYVLKMWYPWPECSVSSIGDLGQAVNSLARLHVSMRRMPKHLLIKQEKLTERDTNIVICCLQTANKTEFCCLQTANNYIPCKTSRTTKAAIHLSRLRRDDIAAHYGLNSCKAIS